MNVCPQPSCWHAIYERLCEACEKYGIASKPPVPLILNGWVYSNDKQKAERWAETKNWAERHGLSSLTVIPDHDWYSVEAPTTHEIGPLGERL